MRRFDEFSHSKQERIACVQIFDNSGGSPILVLGVKMLRPMNETPGANADAGMAAPRLCLEKVENP